MGQDNEEKAFFPTGTGAKAEVAAVQQHRGKRHMAESTAHSVEGLCLADVCTCKVENNPLSPR